MDTSMELDSELSLFPQRRAAPSASNNKVEGAGGLCPGLIPLKSESAVIKCGRWGAVGWEEGWHR